MNTIKLNTMTCLGQHILTAVLTFLSVPVFIHKLGLTQYGVFAAVSVIGNLNMLTNLGLNNALLTYLSQQGKCRKSDHDLIVTQILLLTFFLPLMIAGYIFSDFIIRRVFSIEAEHARAALHLLWFLMPANLLLLLGQSYTAVLDSMQKIYWTNLCQFLYSVLYWGGMLILLCFSADLTLIGAMAFAAALIWFVLLLILVRLCWGKLDFSGLSANFKIEAKQQLFFGAKMYLSGLSGFLFEPLSKILLSHFCGVQYVGCFEIGLKIRGVAAGLVSRTLYPIYPYIAFCKKTEELDALSKNLILLSVKLQRVMVLISVYYIFLMPALLTLWLKQAATTDVILAVIFAGLPYFLFSPPSLPVYFYLPARGYPEKTIYVQLASAISNLAAFFALYKFLGWKAILAANITGFIASYMLCTYYQFQYLKDRFRNWQKKRINALLLFCITSTGAFFFHRCHISAVWELPISFITLTILFIIWNRCFHWFTGQDIAYLPLPASICSSKIMKILIG